MALSRRLLRENPHIAAWHFYSRTQHFKDIVLKQKFNMDDWWGRFEWQGRGSSHCHGLPWGTDSPPPDMETEESRAEFARCWSYHVTAVNPKPDQIGQGGGGNPLCVNPLETPVTWGWLNSIVNRCQRHHCNSQYCLRVLKKKADEAREKGLPEPEPECRFDFPSALREIAEMVQKNGSLWWRFLPKRNDPFMNQYNPLVSLCWLGNIDISPCTSVDAVVNYAAKYCSKGETSTTTFAQITKDILPHVASGKPMLSFVSKMMNKFIGERDYSAQEVCHLLYELPLQDDTRVIRRVDCRDPERHVRFIDLDDEGDVRESNTCYEKYLARPIHMEYVTYFDFLQNWNCNARDPEKWALWHRPSKPRVLLYFPRYPTSHMAQKFTDFCRVKLMLNHHHRNHDELLTVDGERFSSYETAFHRCHHHHDHPDDHYGQPDVETPQAELDEYERGNFEDDIGLEDWQELARLVPELQPAQEPANLLGRRDIDINHDWSANICRYEHEAFATLSY